MKMHEHKRSRSQQTVNPWRWLLFLILACSGGRASAQTVRPLIAELGNPAKGRVEYVNDSLTPLNVVLEPKSFTVAEDGQIAYRDLDPNVHLRLSVTSFRLLPQQSYYVFYEATTDASPTWFVIYAAFSGFPFKTQNGMSVRLELPHTVYLLPKHSLDKTDVVVNHAEFIPAEKKLVLEVENTGANFGRVQQTLVAFGRKKQEAPGFPIFPHSKRRMEIPLDEDGAPSGVELQFPNFKIEQPTIEQSTIGQTVPTRNP
jgi:hypothetical protein